MRRNEGVFCRPGGPLKCTTSGTIWCHLTCALWIPELKVADYTKMVGERKGKIIGFALKIFFDRNLY